VLAGYDFGTVQDIALGRNIPMLRTPEEVKAVPEEPYLVRGLLPARGLAAIFGESGSGKSFLAMDLAFAIATAQPEWFGLKVRQAPVAYVALEGQSGLNRRIRAWEAHHNRELDDRMIRFLTSGFEIADPNIIDALADEVLGTFGRGCVIVIDTLNQSAPGADENNSADMGRIIAGAQSLSARTQGLTILIHHSGKDRSRGLRGHSSLFAAMDAVVEVTFDGECRAWRCSKAKDDERGPERYFSLKPYAVATDSDGLDVTSCAVLPHLAGPAPKLRKLRGKNQKACIEALRAAATTNAADLPWSAALETAAAALTTMPLERRKARAKPILEALIQSGHLSMEQGLLCAMH
jgi:hypothetical protein